MALTTALGSILGFASNTKDARTSTGSESTSTAPSYSPMQSQVQNQTGQTLLDRLTKGVDLTPLRTQGSDQINKAYKGVGDRLSESLAARGFGSSGAVGAGMREIELSKAGAMGSLENSLQSHALEEQDKTLDEASNFGFRNPATSSTSVGSSVGAGSPFAGGLAGGLTAYLQQLNQALALEGG
jgi:hypothetical protein